MHRSIPTEDKDQRWYDNGEALPTELMRVRVTDCAGFSYRALACWDGQGYTSRCDCGAFIEAKI